MILANFFDELVLAPSLRKMVDLETLRLESLYGLTTDILEEKQPEFFIVDWSEHSRLSNRD